MVVERRTATEYEALRPDDVDAGMSWEIIKPAPRTIETKYRKDQLLVNVKHDDKLRTWFVNNTSVNALIDRFTEHEDTWIGKMITLRVAKEEFDSDGKKEIRRVIYLQ